MSGWWIVLFIAVWLACCGLAAWVAAEKGRSAASWFFIAFFLSPLAALLALAALKHTEDAQREQASRIGGAWGNFRACPTCAEAVRSRATRCPHCSAELVAPASA